MNSTPEISPRSRAPSQPAAPETLLPLAADPRDAIPTAEAAAHLGRKPQTLRGWACAEDGPLRPVRVNGRLAWPVSELRRVLGVAA